MPPRERETQELIECLLKRHAEDGTVNGISDAVMRGRAVRQPTLGLVAYKRGGLFVAGREYVISDE